MLIAMYKKLIYKRKGIDFQTCLLLHESGLIIVGIVLFSAVNSNIKVSRNIYNKAVS